MANEPIIQPLSRFFILNSNANGKIASSMNTPNSSDAPSMYILICSKNWVRSVVGFVCWYCPRVKACVKPSHVLG